MAPNAVTALSLINPRLLECYERCATYNANPDQRDTWFIYRNGMADSEGTKFGDAISHVKAHGTVFSGRSSAHRAQMLDEFIKFIPDGVAEFNKRVINLDQDGEGVTISFSDGTSVRAPAVLACDGIKSICRRFILGQNSPQAEPVFAGEYAYRILLDRVEAEAILGPELVHNATLYCGLGGYVVTYPVDKGKLLNCVAVHRTHNVKWEYDDWVVPTSREEMFDDFKDWGTPIRKLFAHIKEPMRWALFDVPPVHTYFHGRICMLGDAAHASTPHQGSGAAMAFEDAYVLSSLLGKTGFTEHASEVFRAYDAVRRMRTQQSTATSRDATLLYAMEHEGIGTSWNKFDRNVTVRHEWIWKEDLPKEVDLATSLLRYYIDQTGTRSPSPREYGNK